MTNVWFIGYQNERTITAADWAANGIDAPTEEWNHDNGWAVPTTDFSSEQLALLDADSEFLLGQTGLRPGQYTAGEHPPVPGKSSAGYYEATKALFDSFMAIDGGEAPTTRVGTYSFETCNTSGNSWTNQGFTTRRQFMVNQKPTRFRVHFRNRDQLAGTDAPGTLTNVQFYIGEPLLEDGTWKGACVDDPIQIQAPRSLTSATELIGPWITPDVFEIEPDKHYVLSQGLKVSAGGNMAISTEPSWQGYDENVSAGASAEFLEPAPNVSWGNAWIEFEYINRLATHVVVIGNSRANGSTVAAPNNGSLSAAVNLWARRNHGVVTMLGVAGLWAGHFNTDNIRWHLYDNTELDIEPDVVYYPDLNSSDMGGSTITVAKDNILAVLALGVAKWPNAKHVLTNIAPRSDFTNGNEVDRLALNQWMHQLMAHPNVHDVLDMDSLVTDWATPKAAIRAPLTSDGLHFTPQGHAVVSRLISF